MEALKVTSCAWESGPILPFLSDSEVHVWSIGPDFSAPLVAELGQTVSAEEREQAGRFRFLRDARHFILARGLLRTILGRYLGRAPTELRFGYGSLGKPFLAGADAGCGIDFSVAHSDGLILLAAARATAVGVDLERVRELTDADRIVEYFFSRREAATLRALAAEDQRGAFFNAWTRKEAYLKATGAGLSDGLRQVEVTLAPGKPARLLAVNGDPAALADWSLMTLPLAPGFVATLAVHGRGWRCRCWRFAPLVQGFSAFCPSEETNESRATRPDEPEVQNRLQISARRVESPSSATIVAVNVRA